MYFSLISPTDGYALAAAHHRADGPYADHQWLWRWFSVGAGTRRDFLFRRSESEGLPRFYVVSAREPVARLGPWEAATREYSPDLERGEKLQFEIRANATVRHDRDGKSSRHDVVMDAKKRLLLERGLAHWRDLTEDRPPLQVVIGQASAQWLAKRGESLGFALDRDSLVVEAYEQHREKSGGSLRFTSVDLVGQLTVTEPSAFQMALMQGIGHAKAFGCGLLLVRRVG